MARRWPPLGSLWPAEQDADGRPADNVGRRRLQLPSRGFWLVRSVSGSTPTIREPVVDLGIQPGPWIGPSAAGSQGRAGFLPVRYGSPRWCDQQAAELQECARVCQIPDDLVPEMLVPSGNPFSALASGDV